MSSKKPKIIVLEGIDGVGKSTQAELLQNYFKEQKISCEFLHFPRLNHQPFGPLIEKYLAGKYGKLNDVDPYLISTLFLHDQYWAFQQLLNKDIILLDRYYYSTFAYQSLQVFSHQKYLDFSNWFNKTLITLKLPIPNLAIFLDVPEIFWTNNLESSTGDLHEKSKPYQNLVYKKYISMIENINWPNLEILHCTDTKMCILTPEEIHRKIRLRIDETLKIC